MEFDDFPDNIMGDVVVIDENHPCPRFHFHLGGRESKIVNRNRDFVSGECCVDGEGANYNAAGRCEPTESFRHSDVLLFG